MKVYQVKVEGATPYFSGLQKFYSRKLFKSREACEIYRDEFMGLCKTPQNDMDMLYLEEITKTEIIVLELVD